MIYIGDDRLYYRSEEDCGYGDVEIGDDIVVTDSNSVADIYENAGCTVKDLSLLCGLPFRLGLYEVYSFFFDGEVKSDIEMIKLLFTWIFQEEDYCFCFEAGSEFCWFAIKGMSVVKLGSYKFESVTTRFEVGRLQKMLNFQIAKTGYKLKYLYKADELRNLLGYSVPKSYYMMSKRLVNTSFVTAEMLVDVLQGYARIQDYELVIQNKPKDFSFCTTASGGTYGLIIDCEGVLGGNGSLDLGCRELGGLIWRKNGRVLVGVETFYCDDKLLESTLLQVMNHLKGYRCSGKIPVITFGISDKKMFYAELHKHSSGFVSKFDKMFEFVDCKRYLDKHVTLEGTRGHLANIARALNVKVVQPRHKAVNDARTLLNVLAMILYETGDFGM